jgi:ribosome-binding factor A
MTNKAFPRSRRVAQQIQRALSELIRREVRDRRLGMVTLTEVRMSSDLSYAQIYYSVLGAERAQAQQILDSAAEMLRGPLGRALKLRHAPELRFVADELIESGARLSALINKAVSEDEARHADESDSEVEGRGTSEPGDSESDQGDAAEDDQAMDDHGGDDQDESEPSDDPSQRSDPNR